MVMCIYISARVIQCNRLAVGSMPHLLNSLIVIYFRTFDMRQIVVVQENFIDDDETLKILHGRETLMAILLEIFMYVRMYACNN